MVDSKENNKFDLGVKGLKQRIESINWGLALFVLSSVWMNVEKSCSILKDVEKILLIVMILSLK